MSFRTRLIQERGRRGWTQQKLADRAGVARSAVAHAETAGKEGPRAITAVRLATALQVRPEWLLEGSGPRVPPYFEFSPSHGVALEELVEAVDVAIEAGVPEGVNRAKLKGQLVSELFSTFCETGALPGNERILRLLRIGRQG